MSLEIFDIDSVKKRIAGNKLRQFPGAAKGRDRLFPYARPHLEGVKFKPDARVFVLGACFGRGLERELRTAGRTVLSSPTNLGLPGSTSEQFQRYNIFNLDVALNELRWALESDDAGVNAALLPVGKHLVDTQLSWAFAHGAKTARKFRRIYNGTYAAARDADLIVMLTGGIEQWFDTEKGLYINTMPGPMAERDTPGRFELHRIGVDEAALTMTQIMDLIRRNSRTTPQFAIAVSPVSQPMIYGPGDALIDQFLAKSVQRLAVERVIANNDDAVYFPVLEAAMWSDFSYTYMENSPNHTGGNFAARMASDLIDAGGACDQPFLQHRALAHGTAMFAGGNMSGVIDLCDALDTQAEDYDEECATTEGRIGIALIQLHLKALVAAHRRHEAFRLALNHIRTDRYSEPLLLKISSLGSGIVSSEERDELVQRASDIGLSTSAIEAMRLSGSEGSVNRMVELQAIEQVRRSGDFNTTLRLAHAFLAKPDGLSTRAKARATVPLIVSLLRLNRVSEAIDAAAEALRTPVVEDRSVLLTAIRALSLASKGRVVETIKLLEGRVDPAYLEPLKKRIVRLDLTK